VLLVSVFSSFFEVTQELTGFSSPSRPLYVAPAWTAYSNFGCLQTFILGVTEVKLYTQLIVILVVINVYYLYSGNRPASWSSGQSF
jgi:hypothetical protein